MPNLFNSETRKGVNQLHEYAGYSLLEWFKHDGYEPEYVLCKNFKADKSNGTCIWNEGEYTTSYQQGQRMFRDRLFELEDFEGLQLPENFNYLKDTLINKAQGDHAKRVDEFPYFYEVMDNYGVKFSDKEEFIGCLSDIPHLEFTSAILGRNIYIDLHSVGSVDDFVELLGIFADEYKTQSEIDALFIDKRNGNFKHFNLDDIKRDCFEVKKSLKNFAAAVNTWRSLDIDSGLHVEFTDAEFANKESKIAFTDKSEWELYFEEKNIHFLKDLPTNKDFNKTADIKKEAVDNARGSSGKNHKNENIER